MGDSPIAFIRETIREFRTTGSLAPSSLFLARALANGLPSDVPPNFKVLEVGPGTGSVTVEVIRRMNGNGSLDMYEINPAFCKFLRGRISKEEIFKSLGGRLKLHEGDVLDLKPQPHYNAIVCGLPFTNFKPAEVQHFFEHFRTILHPKGSLLWYEYVAINKIRAPFLSKERREQLKDIKVVIGRFIRAHQVNQEIVTINLPPARVRHLKFG